jgi:TRAP-type C4-dicarboxylate transport system permease small subunit
MYHLERLVRLASRSMAVIAAIAIVLMVLAVATDVVVRNTTGASLPGMVEIAESGLVVSVFFGLAWAGVRGEHVAVTLVVDRFNEFWTRATHVMVWAVSSSFLAWMLYAATLRAIDSTGMREHRFGLVRWPLYPLRWVIAVGLFALLLVCLLNLVRCIAGRGQLGPNNELEAVLAEVSAAQEAPQASPAADQDPHDHQVQRAKGPQGASSDKQEGTTP